MGEATCPRATQSSNQSVQALCCWVSWARSAQYPAEKAAGVMVWSRNQFAAALPPLHPPGTSLGSQGPCPPIRSTCICHSSILKLKKEEKQSKRGPSFRKTKRPLLYPAILSDQCFGISISRLHSWHALLLRRTEKPQANSSKIGAGAKVLRVTSYLGN